jgi:hypothetical protein
LSGIADFRARWWTKIFEKLCWSTARGWSTQCHTFGRVTSVTRDNLVLNSGFETQIIADLWLILRVLPGQTYEGASGGLYEAQIAVEIDHVRLKDCNQ